MKIKSRKEREKEYREKYGDISNDAYTRLETQLGNKFDEVLLVKAQDRIKEVQSNIEYNAVQFTFYEEPIQSHRPRVNYYTRGLHVPNAKDNHDALEKFIKQLKKTIACISTPMRVELTAYYPMPNNIKPIDMVLYETEHDYAIGKPDFDNVLKAYCDMLLKTIILDDDLVASSEFNKYFSLKPRVVLTIIYTNGCASEYTYNTIRHRKTYKELKDHIQLQLLYKPLKKK